jgi:hypothetical protein
MDPVGGLARVDARIWLLLIAAFALALAFRRRRVRRRISWAHRAGQLTGRLLRRRR